MEIKLGKKSKRNKNSVDYINNEEFLNEIIKSKKNRVMTDKAGEMIFLLATRISKLNNFKNYTYIEDMISDGILRCIEKFQKFDETKSKNPLAYFSQIIFFEFLNRIEKEKKQGIIKKKMFDLILTENIATLIRENTDKYNKDEGE